jgi:hypothetical protein
MPVKLNGFDDVQNFLSGLSAKINVANKTALMKIGLSAEKDAKATIRDQSENWAKLSPKYLAYKTSTSPKRKQQKRYSEKILIRTSSYFQSITSFVKDDKAYIGVTVSAKNSETGQSIAEYARVLEYGSVSKNIPPRPLWSSVLERVKNKAFSIYKREIDKALR